MAARSALLLLALCTSALAASTDIWLEKRISDADLDKLLRTVSDPKSPQYGKYYTPQQIADIVGHSQDEVDAMSQWLTARGLRHTVASTRDRIEVHSDEALLAEHLPVHIFKKPAKVVRREPAAAQIRRETPPSESFTQARSGPFGSNEAREQYGVPASETGEGATQLVWGPGTYGVLKSDLELYWRQFAIRGGSLDNVKFEGYAGEQRGGDNFGEASLDADIISGMAPGALLIVSNTNNSHAPEEGPGFGAAQVAFLNGLLDNSEGVSVVSLSLGSLTYQSCDRLCRLASEADPSITFDSCLDSVQYKQRQVCMFQNDFVVQQGNVEFMKLGLAGITTVAAAGDGGMHFSFIPFNGFTKLGRALNKVACAGSYPTFPAASPYVTAIGGTSWKNGRSNPVYWPGGGSGVAYDFEMPDYQKDAVKGYYAQYDGTAGFPGPDAFNRSNRAYPDVSALADNNGMCANGRCNGAGGTSAAAPTFGGFVTLINAARKRAGKPSLGFLNPALYAAAADHAAEMFTDITSGNTKCNCQECFTCRDGFPATPGFDLATGFGSPKWDGFMKYL